MTSDYDVAIIGASLAGASAAIELGRKGVRVALIDSAAFPRRKPCGEGLSPIGLQQIEQLGVKERILKLPHMSYEGYRVKAQKRTVLISSPWPGGITIQRTLLDNSLLRAALEFPSVTPFLSHKVKALHGTTVETARGAMSAKRIIMACGGNAALLKDLPLRIKRRGPKRSGVSAIYKGAFERDDPWVTILVKRNFEVYCTPLAGGRLNITIVKPAEAPLNLRTIFTSSDLLHEIFKACSFHGGMELAPQGRTDLGNVRRRCDSSSIILAGDAKEEFDPIGGMGMSHALQSGRRAASAAIQALFPLREKEDAYSKDHTIGMRFFTAIAYQTFNCARYFPPVLPFVSSMTQTAVVGFLAREVL